jgi:hypothetical protein
MDFLYKSSGCGAQGGPLFIRDTCSINCLDDCWQLISDSLLEFP